MRSALGRAIIWIWCLAVIGCSASLNDDDTPVLAPQLSLRQALFDNQAETEIAVIFDWADPNLTLASEYVIERSGPAEQFHPVTSTPYLGSRSAALVTIGPEDTAGPYQFRVRRNTDGKPSNAVTYVRAVEAGTFALTQVGGGFSLAYSALRQRPDSLTILRATQFPDGTQGAAQTLFTTTSRSGTFVDNDLSGFVDGNAYAYTLAIRSGGVDAAPLTQETGHAVAAPPEIVSIHSNGAAVHLDVRSTSQLAGTLELSRTDGGPSTAFAPFANATRGLIFSLDDTLPAPGLYQYSLSFTSPRFSASAPQIGSAVFAPPGWSGRFVTVPLFIETARASNGELALLVDIAGTRTLIPPGRPAADGLAVPSNYRPNRLLLDASDRPHAVYPEGASLVHASFDGQAWQKEAIGNFTLGTPADVTVGADGDLWAAWSGSDFRIFVAHRTASAWSVEELPADLVATEALVVAADESSQPHLAGGDASAPFHLFRDGAGWHQETLPVARFQVHSASYIAATSQQIVVVDRETSLTPDSGGTFQARIAIYQHDLIGWRGQEFTVDGGKVADEPFVRAAISPDLSTVSWAQEGGAQLFTLGGANGGGGFAFAEGFAGVPFGMGFNSDGTRWMLYLFRFFGTAARPSTLNAVLYEETP
jgi:hypothetical protein